MSPKVASFSGGVSEPIHVISLGAGVQSSTMALMAAKGEITPMPAAAIFADTQDEPKAVYEWLDWLEKQLPFPVIRVSRGKLSEAALEVHTSKNGAKYTNSNIPVYLAVPNQEKEGKQGRQCTADFKIEVIHKEIRRIAGSQIKQFQSLRRVVLAEQRKHVKAGGFAYSVKNPPAPVIQWIGISTDELVRMKLAHKPYIKNRWPLIELSIRRESCLKWMARNNYPTPPRSACVYCPFHNNAEWRRLRDTDTDGWNQAIEFEKRYQHSMAECPSIKSKPFLHRSLVPLAQANIDEDENNDGQELLAGFKAECSGMCGN